LILDGNRHAHTVEPWDYVETDNLARFEQVDGLSFERVHVTGWEANWGIEDQSYAHATAIVSSSNIYWADVTFTDSRTEGLLFQDCEDVAIERLSTENTDVWSPLNVFYATGFSLTDSTIVEDVGIEWTGSTVNLTVSDAIVSGNSFTGGWGVDFGDETGISPYNPAGITVEDNTIEVAGIGIYFSPYVEGDWVSDVVIRGNTITLHRGEDASETDVGIRLDASANVVIEDNRIEVPDSGEAFVQGIAFRASTDGVRIEDNTLIGVDAGISHSGDTSAGGDLEIRGNSITCAEEIRMDSWNGGSTGVWIFRYVSAEFGTITVENNDIEGIGGWVSLIDYATLSSSDVPPFVEELVVTGNNFLPESGSERDVFSTAADSVTITGNTPDWVNP
jgi:nitrous oxidase accessory protein NosD